MSGRNGQNGPGERRIVVDPRAVFRARQRQLTDGDPLSAPPPSLLPDDDDPDTHPMPFRWSRDMQLQRLTDQRLAEMPDDDLDPVRETLRLRVRPGHRPNRTARIRVYHRLKGAPEAGLEGRCWAFTLSRQAYERLLTERILDSEGATWPNGEPVIPLGVDPLYVPIVCGSCGTQRVECLQMECWQD